MDTKQFAGHTSGEWYTGHFCRDDHTCDCTYILNENRMGAIATVHYSDAEHEPDGDNPPPDEAKANMRLIAAAPDLLAEVERLQAREKVLADALKYYASEEAWTIKQAEGPDGDYGIRARAALETK